MKNNKIIIFVPFLGRQKLSVVNNEHQNYVEPARFEEFQLWNADNSSSKMSKNITHYTRNWIADNLQY